MATTTPHSEPGAAERARREYESTSETKPGLRTTEFISSIVTTLGVLIAALVADGFDAEEAWRLVTFLSIGYMISRGLAKLGASRGRGN